MPIVHGIKAWSGKPEDESPMCGADKNAADVWGHRTVFADFVTCSDCLDVHNCCVVCGNVQRHPGTGCLTCECPAQITENERQEARSMLESLPKHRGGW